MTLRIWVIGKITNTRVTSTVSAAILSNYCSLLLVRITDDHQELGPVIINRTGWSHMTRVGRPLARIQASFECLPAAARIVATVRNWRVLRRGEAERSFRNGSWATYEYLGLSVMVRWAACTPSEVMVILRRQTIFSGVRASTEPNAKVSLISRKTWLYAVYEPG